MITGCRGRVYKINKKGNAVQKGIFGSIPRAAKDIIFLMSTLPAFLELTKTYDIKQQETLIFAFS